MSELRSYEPSWRDKIAWGVADNVSQTRYGKQNLAKTLGNVLDFIPGVGTALGADDTKRSYQEGDAVGTTINGASTLASLIPGFTPAAKAFGTAIDQLPPLLRGYHGTNRKAMFDKPQWVPEHGDLGIHAAADPEIAARYAGIQDKSRIYPVAADARNPLGHDERFEIGDAINWMQPDTTMDALSPIKDYPEYKHLWDELSDLRHNVIDGRDWQGEFPDILQTHGYDSIWYAHEGQKDDMALMMLNNDQVKPLFAPETQAEIAQRGILSLPATRPPIEQEYPYLGSSGRYFVNQIPIEKAFLPPPANMKKTVPDIDASAMKKAMPNFMAQAEPGMVIPPGLHIPQDVWTSPKMDQFIELREMGENQDDVLKTLGLWRENAGPAPAPPKKKPTTLEELEAELTALMNGTWEDNYVD